MRKYRPILGSEHASAQPSHPRAPVAQRRTASRSFWPIRSPVLLRFSRPFTSPRKQTECLLEGLRLVWSSWAAAIVCVGVI